MRRAAGAALGKRSELGWEASTGSALGTPCQKPRALITSLAVCPFAGVVVTWATRTGGVAEISAGAAAKLAETSSASGAVRTRSFVSAEASCRSCGLEGGSGTPVDFGLFASCTAAAASFCGFASDLFASDLLAVVAVACATRRSLPRRPLHQTVLRGSLVLCSAAGYRREQSQFPSHRRQSGS